MLAEASLCASKLSSCLGQVVKAIVHHSLHCLQDVRLTGRYEDVTPCGLPAFFDLRLVAPGTIPLGKLSFSVDSIEKGRRDVVLGCVNFVGGGR